MYYVLTKGGGLPDFDLQKELVKVADFSSLPSHKVPARLEVREDFLFTCYFLRCFPHRFHLHLTQLLTTSYLCFFVIAALDLADRVWPSGACP